MKNSRTYQAPVTDIIQLNADTSVMIEIGSGETSPEESDSNRGFVEDEEDYLPRTKSLWE